MDVFLLTSSHSASIRRVDSSDCNHDKKKKNKKIDTELDFGRLFDARQIRIKYVIGTDSN